MYHPSSQLLDPNVPPDTEEYLPIPPTPHKPLDLELIQPGSSNDTGRNTPYSPWIRGESVRQLEFPKTSRRLTLPFFVVQQEQLLVVLIPRSSHRCKGLDWQCCDLALEKSNMGEGLFKLKYSEL